MIHRPFPSYTRFSGLFFLALFALNTFPWTMGSGELRAETRFVPGRLASMSDYNRAFDRLYRLHRTGFARLRFYPNNASLKGADIEQFLQRGSSEFRKWKTAKARLTVDYGRLARGEKRFLKREFARARERDRRQGGFKNVSDFLTRDRSRAARRNRQVARIQRLLDSTDSRLNRRFRYQFHIKLDQEMKALRARGANQQVSNARKQAVNSMITRYHGSGTRSVTRRRRYMRHWTAWFFDRLHPPRKVVAVKKEPKKTPPPVKKTVIKKEPVKKTTPVVVRKKEPVAVVKKQPKAIVVKKVRREPPREVVRKVVRKVVRRTEPKRVVRRPKPRRVFPVLPCRNNSCTLAQYRRFAAALKRSCYRSKIPDVLIKDCFQNFVSMDLSLPRQKEIFYFLRFDSGNYYERLSGLRYFEEQCYKFRPVLELGSAMLQDPSFGITPEQKIRIRFGLKNIRTCSR